MKSGYLHGLENFFLQIDITCKGKRIITLFDGELRQHTDRIIKVNTTNERQMDMTS